MQRTLVIIVIVSIAIMAIDGCSEKEDIVGWDKARWGMTLSELEKLYELEGWVKTEFNRRPLKKQYEIGGFNFGGNFVFDRRSPSGELFEINLWSMTENAKNKDIYEKLMSLYIRKYGKPRTDKEEVTKTGQNKRIAIWNRPSGRVTHRYEYSNLHEMAVCLITYQRALPEIDKK
jgi:hypothetical protein